MTIQAKPLSADKVAKYIEMLETHVKGSKSLSNWHGKEYHIQYEVYVDILAKFKSLVEEAQDDN